MDQIKTGKFIAECRKKENLTQMQLAEKLNITDKAVSKWECGKAMPDSSIMIELCDILKISVNDLLCGEKVTTDSGKKESEKILLEIIQQKEESDKRLLHAEIVIGVFSMAFLLIPIIIGAFIQTTELYKTLVIFSGFIPAIAGFCFALKAEQVAGYYECRHCSHKYVPTYKAVFSARHIGRKRYMKCPECGKKSWQKKVLNKN